jgi:L,D-transpeptidase catalytic domain
MQASAMVRAEPSFGARQLGRVASTTPWGGPAQLLVIDFRIVGTERWALVRLPGRPNSNRGWITDANVKFVQTAWRIEVSRARRELRVLKGGELMRLVPVVVGAPSTPTPAGLFAIADRLRQPNPNRFSGSWVLPLTAHSNVLRYFDGGDGQVALHGRGGASLRDPVGTARSHGCIRLSNDSVAWIAARVPTGTPVIVE